MNRRQLLEDVAAGRISPRDGARLLAEHPSPSRVRVHSAYQAVEVTGDPAVADVVVDHGAQHVHRQAEAFVVRGAGGRIALRVNPAFGLDVEVTGAALVVQGVDGPLRAVLQAGTGTLEDVHGALDLRVVTGAARVAGSPRHADWRIRADSASLDVRLEADADVTVSVVQQHCHVDVLGDQPPVVLGRGTRLLEIGAAFADVGVRAA
jgi:hypothetical protein